jgi:hypothetical protein
MLRELQTLYNDPKMLQYAPRSLLPKMGAGRVDKEGQGIRHGRAVRAGRNLDVAVGSRWPWDTRNGVKHTAPERPDHGQF